MSKPSLFSKIDSILFEQVDKLQNLSFVSTIQDELSALEDEPRSIINKLSFIVFISLPIIVLTAFFISNLFLRKDLNFRKEIWSKGKEFVDTGKIIQRSAGSVLSLTPINDDASFQAQIKSAASMAGVAATQFQTSGFVQTTISDSINKASINMKFNGISTEEMTKFFSSLAINKKMKVSEISITRSKPNGLLSGIAKIINFSRKSN